MKQLMIVLYAGLALVVWLVFIPDTDEDRQDQDPLTRTLPDQAADHETADHWPDHQAAASAPNRADPHSGTGTTRKQGVYTESGSTTRGWTLPQAGRRHTQPHADETYDEQDPNRIEPGDNGRRDNMAVANSALSSSGSRLRTAAQQDTTSRTANRQFSGFSFTANTARTGTARQAQTGTTATTQDPTQNKTQNSVGKQDTRNTQRHRSNTTTSDSLISGQVSEQKVAAQDTDTALLPNGKTRQTRPERTTTTQKFICPKHCYIRCTAYEINMLVKQGCPIPVE